MTTIRPMMHPKSFYCICLLLFFMQLVFGQEQGSDAYIALKKEQARKAKQDRNNVNPLSKQDSLQNIRLFYADAAQKIELRNIAVQKSADASEQERIAAQQSLDNYKKKQELLDAFDKLYHAFKKASKQDEKNTILEVKGKINNLYKEKYIPLKKEIGHLEDIETIIRVITTQQ